MFRFEDATHSCGTTDTGRGGRSRYRRPQPTRRTIRCRSGTSNGVGARTPEGPNDRLQGTVRPTPDAIRGLRVVGWRFLSRRLRFGDIDPGGQNHRRGVDRGGVTVYVDHRNGGQAGDEKEDPCSPQNWDRAEAPSQTALRMRSRRPAHRFIATSVPAPRQSSDASSAREVPTVANLRHPVWEHLVRSGPRQLPSSSNGFGRARSRFIRRSEKIHTFVRTPRGGHSYS